MGPDGGKIRAGRSRNDQAANDLRLYMRDKVRTLSALVVELAQALAGQAEQHLHTPVPGFTHLQSAQPGFSATSSWPTPSRCCGTSTDSRTGISAPRFRRLVPRRWPGQRLL